MNVLVLLQRGEMKAMHATAHTEITSGCIEWSDKMAKALVENGRMEQGHFALELRDAESKVIARSIEVC